MKTKSQKYEEAVARNLKHHKSLLRNPIHPRHNMSWNQLKHVIGIRRGDDHFNSQLYK